MTDAPAPAAEIPDDDLPLGDTLTVGITVPDARFLDEAGLARWFPHLDGKWTDQTKALLARFGTTRLDLNWNWFETPVDWRCGCCGRGKPEIARPTEGGVLLAHLHLHHDHMREHLGGLMNERLGTPWAKDLPPSSRLADEPMRALVVRFRDTLVCDGCNTAEGEAKKALVLPRHFSFAPSEIARFVRARPNAMNEIDVEEARRAWLSVKAGYESRLAFADVLVDRLASGLFATERAPNSLPLFRHSPLTEFLSRHARDDAPARDLQAWGYRFWSDLAERSLSRDAVGNSGRPRRQARVRPPTDEEFAAFEAKPAQAWERTPPDWSCPCCARGKRAILRRSNSRKWFGQIRILDGVDFETDAENLAFRRELYPDHLDAPVVAGQWWRYVCSDCGDVISDLQRSRPDLGRLALTLEDIRDCLGEIRDNEKTDIDLERAAEKAEANYDLQRAQWEYTVHRGIALHLWKLRRCFGADANAEAREALLKAVREEGLDTEAIPGGLRWLLLQGKAFDAEGGTHPT